MACQFKVLFALLYAVNVVRAPAPTIKSYYSDSQCQYLSGFTTEQGNGVCTAADCSTSAPYVKIQCDYSAVDLLRTQVFPRQFSRLQRFSTSDCSNGHIDGDDYIISDGSCNRGKIVLDGGRSGKVFSDQDCSSSTDAYSIGDVCTGDGTSQPTYSLLLPMNVQRRQSFYYSNSKCEGSPDLIESDLIGSCLARSCGATGDLRYPSQSTFCDLSAPETITLIPAGGAGSYWYVKAFQAAYPSLTYQDKAWMVKQGTDCIRGFQAANNAVTVYPDGDCARSGQVILSNNQGTQTLGDAIYLLHSSILRIRKTRYYFPSNDVKCAGIPMAVLDYSYNSDTGSQCTDEPCSFADGYNTFSSCQIKSDLLGGGWFGALDIIGGNVVDDQQTPVYSYPRIVVSSTSPSCILLDVLSIPLGVKYTQTSIEASWGPRAKDCSDSSHYQLPTSAIPIPLMLFPPLHPNYNRFLRFDGVKRPAVSQKTVFVYSGTDCSGTPVAASYGTGRECVSSSCEINPANPAQSLIKKCASGTLEDFKTQVSKMDGDFTGISYYADRECTTKHDDLQVYVRKDTQCLSLVIDTVASVFAFKNSNGVLENYAEAGCTGTPEITLPSSTTCQPIPILGDLVMAYGKLESAADHTATDDDANDGTEDEDAASSARRVTLGATLGVLLPLAVGVLGYFYYKRLHKGTQFSTDAIKSSEYANNTTVIEGDTKITKEEAVLENTATDSSNASGLKNRYLDIGKKE